jgi:hypothetical protein
MSQDPEFPEPIRRNGRLFFVDRQVENYKRALAGLPLLPDDPNAPIKFRPAASVAADFGFGRRTLGRRIAKRSDEANGKAA